MPGSTTAVKAEKQFIRLIPHFFSFNSLLSKVLKSAIAFHLSSHHPLQNVYKLRSPITAHYDHEHRQSCPRCLSTLLLLKTPPLNPQKTSPSDPNTPNRTTPSPKPSSQSGKTSKRASAPTPPPSRQSKKSKTNQKGTTVKAKERERVDMSKNSPTPIPSPPSQTQTQTQTPSRNTKTTFKNSTNTSPFPPFPPGPLPPSTVKETATAKAREP